MPATYVEMSVDADAGGDSGGASAQDEMEEEEQELNALAPEFMDGDVVLGKVNDVPSFPVFKGEILNAPEETLNVVEFTFSWCRPCKKFAAKYDMFAEYYNKVRFFKVVGDSDPEKQNPKSIVDFGKCHKRERE